MQSQDINVAAELFQETFNAVANVHAPFKFINVKEGAPAWVTGDYLSHVDERKQATKTCKKSPTPENIVRKVEAVQRTFALKNSLQRSFFQESLTRHRGDMKRTWDTIKKFWPYLNKKGSSIPTRAGENMKEKAEKLNKHFETPGI